MSFSFGIPLYGTCVTILLMERYWRARNRYSIGESAAATGTVTADLLVTAVSYQHKPRDNIFGKQTLNHNPTETIK